MERLARQFTREFHRAAEQAQAVGEDAVESLRGILGDTLDRIRTEVFGTPGHTGPHGDSGPAGAGEQPPGTGGGTGDDSPGGDSRPGEPGSGSAGRPR
jgi:hypothetical protein